MKVLLSLPRFCGIITSSHNYPCLSSRKRIPAVGTSCPTLCRGLDGRPNKRAEHGAWCVFM